MRLRVGVLAPVVACVAVVAALVVSLVGGAVPAAAGVPVVTSVPVVSGRTMVGEVLSASPGVWSGGPHEFVFRWQDCREGCVDVPGAVGPSLTLGRSDLGRRLRVVVTATGPGGLGEAVSGVGRVVGWLYDGFSGPDGVVANEYTHFSPGSGTHRSADWDMTSGCLFRVAGRGATGVPDFNAGSSVDSCQPNNNARFRLNSRAVFEGRTAVFVDVRQNTDSHDAGCESGGRCYYGVHVWARYRSQFDLYYASVQRADGKVVLKRKVPCGSDNGGFYVELGAGEVRYDWSPGVWEKYKLTVEDVGAAVVLRLYDMSVSPPALMVSATDRGGVNPRWSPSCATPGKYAGRAYPPLTGSGQVGLRTDYVDVSFDNVTVAPW